MFVFDVIGRLARDGPICVFDLEVDRAVFGFRVVGVPPEAAADGWLSPLYPVMGLLTLQVELDTETSDGRRILAFEKYDGVDLGNDFVGIAS